MAARKLQQDIDKTIKKVGEGIQAFEAIYEKIQQTTNLSQKEKLEDNLKREIKKLQRHRDQIKTWAAGNEIKDKKPLLEQRKLIENEMEKFKAVEKEMKTKAFSKEGLSAAAKLDPKEREKLESCQFLSETVEELERQIEMLEAEEEALQATVKKGKKDAAKAERLSETARLTERHKWHQGKLELLLRALENGSVETEQVNDLKDSIKYYVDENQSVEFQEDDSLYDDLNLEQDEGVWGLNNDGDKVSSQDTQSVHEEVPDTVEGRGSSVSGKAKQSSASEPAVAAARRPSNQFKSPLPALATLHTPHGNATSTVPPPNMKPAPIPTRAAGEPLKYASAAAAATANDKNGFGIAPLPPPPGATSSLPISLPSPSALEHSATTSPSIAPSLPLVVESTFQPKVPITAPAPQIASRTQSQTRSPSLSHASTTQGLLASSVPPTPPLERAETALPPPLRGLQSSRAATASEKEATPEPEQPITPPQPADYTTIQPNGNTTIGQEESSIYHLPPCLQELADSFEITKQRAFSGPNPTTQRYLTRSLATIPSSYDAARPRQYHPQIKYTTPRHYPQEPSAIIDDPSLYGRIDTDTLFFIFYYRQGTHQQCLAAKSLKAQSWRFHKQYQTWFQRHEEPKNITEEFEQGTYRFFDYESTWMNRRKANFQFAYKFLEDDL